MKKSKSVVLGAWIFIAACVIFNTLTFRYPTIVLQLTYITAAIGILGIVLCCLPLANKRIAKTPSSKYLNKYNLFSKIIFSQCIILFWLAIVIWDWFALPQGALVEHTPVTITNIFSMLWPYQFKYWALLFPFLQAATMLMFYGYYSQQKTKLPTKFLVGKKYALPLRAYVGNVGYGAFYFVAFILPASIFVSLCYKFGGVISTNAIALLTTVVFLCLVFFSSIKIKPKLIKLFKQKTNRNISIPILFFIIFIITQGEFNFFTALGLDPTTISFMDITVYFQKLEPSLRLGLLYWALGIPFIIIWPRYILKFAAGHSLRLVFLSSLILPICILLCSILIQQNYVAPPNISYIATTLEPYFIVLNVFALITYVKFAALQNNTGFLNPDPTSAGRVYTRNYGFVWYHMLLFGLAFGFLSMLGGLDALMLLLTPLSLVALIMPCMAVYMLCCENRVYLQQLQTEG